MNELDQKDYWYPRRKKIVKFYVQSQWRVVLLWYHIFWQSSIQRGRHTQLCMITSLKWIIQICSNFYCWVCKILLSTLPIHIVIWGNFPFNNKSSSSFELLYSKSLLYTLSHTYSTTQEFFSNGNILEFVHIIFLSVSVQSSKTCLNTWMWCMYILLFCNLFKFCTL